MPGRKPEWRGRLGAQEPLASKRLFFALWPTDEFRAELEAATLAVARASGGRLIPPRNFHVTLLFLGEISPALFPAVQQAGAALAGNPAFQFEFDNIESWGRKVLCLTTSTPPSLAIELAEKLRASLNRTLQHLDDRPYRPHITLARDLPRGWRPQAIKTLRQRVDEVALVESVRDAGGSFYSVLERWPLQ